jgi:hypothetical protein
MESDSMTIRRAITNGFGDVPRARLRLAGVPSRAVLEHELRGIDDPFDPIHDPVTP